MKYKISDYLKCDPATGSLVWLVGKHKGKAAGWVGRNGYKYVCVKQKIYLAHRIVWFFVNGEWPSVDIDHIDGNRTNNAIGNLRSASRSQNLANSKIKSTNTSGFKGVCFFKPHGKWRARITVNYKEITIGYFDSAQDASEAYIKTARKYFGNFARAA